MKFQRRGMVSKHHLYPLSEHKSGHLLCSPSVETPGQACAQLPAWSQAVWRCWGPPQPSSGAPASLPAFYSFLRRSVHCGNVWNNVSKLSFVWVLVLRYWCSKVKYCRTRIAKLISDIMMPPLTQTDIYFVTFDTWDLSFILIGWDTYYQNHSFPPIGWHSLCTYSCSLIG